MSDAASVDQAAQARAPVGVGILGVERMSAAFVKYHLADGRALHHFSAEERRADPHDHPWSFESEIVEGGYVEEVFHVHLDGGWSSELIQRLPGSVHRVTAEHIHRIVALPQRDCWTLVRAGPHERVTRFWRFAATVRSRAWNERRWQVHVATRVAA